MQSFGWEYPPGAEHDPRAPWNDPGYDDSRDPEECQCGEPADPGGMCDYCAREEAALQRWERRREEGY